MRSRTCSVGAGTAVDPGVGLASVLVLQGLFDLSDPQTADAPRYDLRWKVATGRALDQHGVDPTTLVYWRSGWRNRSGRTGSTRRCGRSSRRPDLRGRRKRAVDSTILADAVATQDTITQLISAIRRVGRIVPGAAEAIATVCTGHDYRRPGKPAIDWDEPGAKDTLVSALVNDANALLEALAGIDEDEAEGPVAAALALLALVAGQDVEPAEGSDGTDGRWRIARKVPRPGDIHGGPGCAAHPQVAGGPPRRVSGARGGGAGNRDHHRRGAHQGGRDGELRSGGGGEVRAPTGAADGADQGGAREWYGDSAYGTGDWRAAIDDVGHDAVIKPKPLTAPVEGGFTVDDFTIDEQAGTVGCPAGDTRPLSRTRVASFGALCRDCPLLTRCTTSKTGRKIVLHQQDDMLRAARRDWAADPELREKYRKNRPNVERVVSQIASRGGRRTKTPLPRHRQEQRLAHPPHRRAQPA